STSPRSILRCYSAGSTTPGGSRSSSDGRRTGRAERRPGVETRHPPSLGHKQGIAHHPRRPVPKGSGRREHREAIDQIPAVLPAHEFLGHAAEPRPLTLVTKRGGRHVLVAPGGQI